MGSTNPTGEHTTPAVRRRTPKEPLDLVRPREAPQRRLHVTWLAMTPFTCNGGPRSPLKCRIENNQAPRPHRTAAFFARQHRFGDISYRIDVIRAMERLRCEGRGGGCEGGEGGEGGEWGGNWVNDTWGYRPEECREIRKADIDLGQGG